jgi:hypothetical protein
MKGIFMHDIKAMIKIWISFFSYLYEFLKYSVFWYIMWLGKNYIISIRE